MVSHFETSSDSKFDVQYNLAEVATCTLKNEKMEMVYFMIVREDTNLIYYEMKCRPQRHYDARSQT
jgi:isocitrate/isopropylmalate dehydrogenase